MNRRDFLKQQVRGAILLGAGASGLLRPELGLASGEPDLAVVKGSPAAATRAAVEILGGIKQFVKPGHRVVIKPNMSFASGPDSASNTHPAVVAELVIMCKEAGAAKVLVLDNPLAPAEQCLEKSGIVEACEVVERGLVHMVNTGRLFREVAIPQGKGMTETGVMKEVLDSDVLIAAPVAKSHSGTGVSLSMKGMMGLIYNRQVMHYKYDLHTSIVDICTVLKPDLTVIDATRVLSTNGPGGPGKVLRPDIIIASRDMVAADAQTVSMFKWYGRRFKPSQVRHIREAHERGLGRMDLKNLNIKTVSV